MHRLVSTISFLEFYSLFNSFASFSAKGRRNIIAALQKIFPENSFDLELVSPLSWDAAIMEFLLPEVALLLIQEDHGVDEAEARRMLRGISQENTVSF